MSTDIIRQDLIERIGHHLNDYDDGNGDWLGETPLDHCTTLTLLEEALVALEKKR